MISKELRAELKEAWEKSTQGEWRVDERVRDGERIYHIVAGNEKLGDLPLGRMWGDNAVWLERGGEGENATFSVLAHNSMSALLETIEELEGERDEANTPRPFDRQPDSHAKHTERWLTSNQKEPQQVRWSLYPIGMVGRWIERAESAESRATQAEAERDAAKEICRNTVNALGGFAAPEVSVEFLSHLPNEAKLLRAERDRMKEEVETLRKEMDRWKSIAARFLDERDAARGEGFMTRMEALISAVEVIDDLIVRLNLPDFSDRLSKMKQDLEVAIEEVASGRAKAKLLATHAETMGCAGVEIPVVMSGREWLVRAALKGDGK